MNRDTRAPDRRRSVPDADHGATSPVDRDGVELKSGGHAGLPRGGTLLAVSGRTGSEQQWKGYGPGPRPADSAIYSPHLGTDCLAELEDLYCTGGRAVLLRRRGTSRTRTRVDTRRPNASGHRGASAEAEPPHRRTETPCRKRGFQFGGALYPAKRSAGRTRVGKPRPSEQTSQLARTTGLRRWREP